MRPPISVALAESIAPAEMRADAAASAPIARPDASLFRMAATTRLGVVAIPLVLLWAAIVSLLS